MSEHDWQALFLTVKLASATTIILLLLGVPLAWWLSRSEGKVRHVVESIVALPLVLPPTVLGFYLLILLAPHGPFSGLYDAFGVTSLAFSFTGLLIGSCVYSLPFVVQPLQTGFASINRQTLEMAETLGAESLDRFMTIVLPQAKGGVIAATVLGFAHTLGEFGVVLMIGGNIPGETQVLSIAIYEHVESLQYAKAHLISAILLATSFLLMLALFTFTRRGVVGWNH